MLGDVDEFGVRAGDDQRQQRKRRVGLFVLASSQPVGVDVRLQVIHAEKGQPARQRQRLARRQPDQQRSRQPRPIGRGDGVYRIPSHARLGEGGLQHGDNSLQLVARGDLWHDTAVLGVDARLRGDDVGVDDPPILDERDAGLVAGAFNRQDAQ